MRHQVAPGRTMVTLDELLEQLGGDVTEEMVRNWHRRWGLTRVLVAGEWWIHLEAAIECEHRARASGLGRPRRTGTTPPDDDQTGRDEVH